MDEAMDKTMDESEHPRASLKRKASAVGCAMWTPIVFPARSLAPAASAEVSAPGNEASGTVASSANDSGSA
jgi:hypothetical protein